MLLNITYPQVKTFAQQTPSLKVNFHCSLFFYPSAPCQFRLIGLVQLKSLSENNSPAGVTCEEHDFTSDIIESASPSHCVPCGRYFLPHVPVPEATELKSKWALTKEDTALISQAEGKR